MQSPGNSTPDPKWKELSVRAAERLTARDFAVAVTLAREGLNLNPEAAELHATEGIALMELGKVVLATRSLLRSVELNPNSARVHSALIYAIHFNPQYGLKELGEEAARWDRLHALRLRPDGPPFTGARLGNRRLKVGYVSPHFRWHAQAYFVLPLLEAHDRDRIEIHLYSSVAPRPDDLTERYARACDHWHDVTAMNDEQLAIRIHADQIDVLVDPCMHMAQNRMLTFALKPAPIQVTWLAYPGTTGLRTFDARLTDPHQEPLGQDDSWSAEPPVRLPETWAIYDPLTALPDPGELPALRNGYITFGSLNSFKKVNGQVLARWANVLSAVPASRLRILCTDAAMAANIRRAFAAANIDPQRIEAIPPSPREPYLAEYQQVDIGLDPFPYNGITTALDSLWMGVPVLTLPGQVPASRAGLSILANVGLHEFVATSEGDYIARAVQFATDLPRLATLRASLRERIKNSPLHDAPRFARLVERVYLNLYEGRKVKSQ